mgnify:CR=1 FL=1
MKKNNFKKIIILSSILIILVISIAVVYFMYSVIDVVYIDFDFKVSDPKHIGFNVDSDALHFGIIPPGGNGHRDLILENEERVRVLIKVIGSDYVYPNKNNFILGPNNSTSVEFSASPPLDTLPGNYSGKVRIIFKRVSESI